MVYSTKYMVVHGVLIKDGKKFVDEINRHLDEGWEVQGGDNYDYQG